MMFRACINQSCLSRDKAQQLPYCPTCFSPTQARYNQADFSPPAPDYHQIIYDGQPRFQIPLSPDTPRHLIAPQARKPPPAFDQPGEAWTAHPQGSAPWMTPPLSSKRTTPGSHIATPFSTVSRPGSSLSKAFNFYNPKCEKKARDRAKRTCISCYNRSDRKCELDVESCEHCLSNSIWCRTPIKTPNLFDIVSYDKSVHKYLSSQPALSSEEAANRPSACVLSFHWPSTELDLTSAVSDTHKSSYNLDTKGLFENDNISSCFAQIEAILDCDTVPIVGEIRRTTEEGYVDTLQALCRQLCSLLHALADPSKNTIIYTVNQTSCLRALAYGIMRQLYHKVVAIWETIFEHVRLWAFGLRNKTSFPSQRKTVAESLAQVCTCIETYAEVPEMDFPACRLASDHRPLLSELEFLGRGIDTRRFDAARQAKPTNMAIFSISIVDGSAYATTTISEVTFHELLYQKPPSGPQSRIHGGSIYQPSSASTSYPSTETPPSSLAPPKNVKSLLPSIQTADPEMYDSNIDRRSTDKLEQLALQQQTKSTILELQTYLEQEKQQYEAQQRLLEERQQKIRRIEEEVYHHQLRLGPAQPPAHLNMQNVFDEMQTYQDGPREDSGSPGDMTLVEPELNSNLDLDLPEASSTQSHPSISDLSFDHDYFRSLEFVMEALAPEPDADDNDDAATSTGDKKRKRLSFLPAAKKARKGEHPVEREAQAVAIRATATNPHHMTPSLHLIDTDNPSTTARPTSWPRSRLFRRSAGVSVKKITEVFEKMRLQYDKALPAAPS